MIWFLYFSGRPYLFQVRAFNRVGSGPWSESLEVVSGAGAPDTPNAPRVQCRGPNLAILDWNEPSFNGAMVTEYRLQLAIGKMHALKIYNPFTLNNSRFWPIPDRVLPPIYNFAFFL